MVSSYRSRSSGVWTRSAFGLLVVDEEREHRAVPVEERLHVDDQVLQHGEPADRLDRHLGRDVFDEDLAREGVAAVDHHRVRAADAVGARAAEREGPVVMPLHLVEHLDQPLERVHLDRELVPPRVLGDLRVEPPDLGA